MERSELIEWIVIILCILLFWPLIFGFHPVWYRVFVYGGEIVALTIILFRRYSRMKAGLKYSEESLRNQPPGPPTGR